MSQSVEIPRRAVVHAITVYENSRAAGCSSTSSMTAALAAAAPLLGTRPMPTREQIAEALRDVSVLDYATPPAEKSLSGSERERVADALLALLNGAES